MENTMTTKKVKKTRFVFKPWVEKLLASILAFNFVLLLTISDVASIPAAIIVYGILLGSSYLIIRLLNKYGKDFKLN